MPILIFVFFATLLAGIPVFIALAFSSLLYTHFIAGIPDFVILHRMAGGLDSFPLLAVPFFILAGELMNAGGLSQRIVRLGLALVGHKRGGLGYVAILASVILASLSGSAIADAAAISAILLPMMRIGGYDANRSAGLIAASRLIAHDSANRRSCNSSRIW